MDPRKLREAMDAADAKLKEVSESTTEPTRSKVFDSYNTAHPEGDELKGKKQRNREKVDLEKLELRKECGECGKMIKDAKKALQCKCKVVLFCSHTCVKHTRK